MNYAILFICAFIMFSSIWLFKKKNGGRNALAVMLILIGGASFGLDALHIYNCAKQYRINEVVNQDQHVILNRTLSLTNQMLSKEKPDSILSKYSENGQQTIKALYGDNQTSENYGLTLIGKKIPTFTLNDVNNQNYTITNNTVIVILNNNDKSKDFVKSMNAINSNKLQFLALFPVNNNNDAKKFCSDNHLNNNWHIMAMDNNPETQLHPDLKKIAISYFNVAGVPSYVTINNNRITLAGTGVINEDSFKNFVNYGFKTPYIYTMTKIKSN